MKSDFVRSKSAFDKTKPKYDFNDRYKSYDKMKTKYDEKLNFRKDVASKNKMEYNNNYEKTSQSDVKTITPNFVHGKKDGLHEEDQKTVTVSRVLRVPDETQHPSDLSELEDGLKLLTKPDPLTQYVNEEPGEYIVAGTEELKNTESVVVVPESMPKEIKRSIREKRSSRIKEYKDYHFIPRLKQKSENSIANCDHCVLVNHKRRKKIDAQLKTCYSNHLLRHRITKFKGVMEQTVQLVQDLLQ
ncbi:hypothetical protein TNCT_216321 [Trichonephila clavata]|uniref:Uncharacterized protein n=1 Tax=Trichonephila clavata TaxID=2740835 RepID=A0A8X6HV76_TRICU|nr:hypothetical protein TNCT_216321 [Trichonephila clavata]